MEDNKLSVSQRTSQKTKGPKLKELTTTGRDFARRFLLNPERKRIIIPLFLLTFFLDEICVSSTFRRSTTVGENFLVFFLFFYSRKKVHLMNMVTLSPCFFLLRSQHNCRRQWLFFQKLKQRIETFCIVAWSVRDFISWRPFAFDSFFKLEKETTSMNWNISHSFFFVVWRGFLMSFSIWPEKHHNLRLKRSVIPSFKDNSGLVRSQ